MVSTKQSSAAAGVTRLGEADGLSVDGQLQGAASQGTGHFDELGAVRSATAAATVGAVQRYDPIVQITAAVVAAALIVCDEDRERAVSKGGAADLGIAGWAGVGGPSGGVQPGGGGVIARRTVFGVL